MHRAGVHVVFFVMMVAVIACGTSDSPPAQDQGPNDSNRTVIQFDSARAATFGADDYGMRKYVMAFLRRGPNSGTFDSARAAQLQMAHLENIGRMAEEGTLVLAGPFFGDGDLRGIYVFAVDNIAEAEALTNTDPAIQAGSLEMDLVEWYASAGLMGLYDMHMSIAKKNVTD
ncbi:MAG: YciI family protein [Saprospiraceae bacterium]|nr:YciI family protein [Saprospiraceae bacterium]